MAEIDKDTSEQYQGKTFVFPEKSIGLLSELLLGAFVAVLSDFALENGKKNKDTKRQQGKDNYSDRDGNRSGFYRNDP